MQESCRHSREGVSRCQGAWIVQGLSEKRTAVSLILSERAGKRVWLDEYLVVAELALSPPILAMSVYFPSVSLGRADFEGAVFRLYEALKSVSRPHFLVGRDFNTQAKQGRYCFGQHASANERAWEATRAEMISDLFAK